MSIVAEFQRPVEVHAVPMSGMTRSIAATASEREALARRFDLVRIDSLEVDLELSRDHALLRVAGTVRARLAQRCVVTLEPVDATVEASFERVFSPDVPEATAEEVEILADDDTPEPLPGDRLDLGEIAAEELSLALDPYPHAPGAEEALAELRRREEQGDESAGRFGALAALRKH